MVVETRIYKQFDADLLALHSAGYPVREMMRDSIIAYAAGTPLNYFIDEVIPFDFDDKKTAHMRFSIPDSNEKACYLLKSIRKGYRNCFCKAVLRNALMQINLPAFFNDAALLQLQSINLYYKGASSFQNVVPLSSIRAKKKQVTFGDYSVEHSTGQAVAKVVPSVAMPVASTAPVVPSPVASASEQGERRRGRPKKAENDTNPSIQRKQQAVNPTQPLPGVPTAVGVNPYNPFYQPLPAQPQFPIQAPPQVPVQGYPYQPYPVQPMPVQSPAQQPATVQQAAFSQPTAQPSFQPDLIKTSIDNIGVPMGGSFPSYDNEEREGQILEAPSANTLPQITVEDNSGAPQHTAVPLEYQNEQVIQNEMPIQGGQPLQPGMQPAIQNAVPPDGNDSVSESDATELVNLFNAL